MCLRCELEKWMAIKESRNLYLPLTWAFGTTNAFTMPDLETTGNERKPYLTPFTLYLLRIVKNSSEPTCNFSNAPIAISQFISKIFFAEIVEVHLGSLLIQCNPSHLNLVIFITIAQTTYMEHATGLCLKVAHPDFVKPANWTAPFPISIIPITTCDGKNWR